MARALAAMPELVPPAWQRALPAIQAAVREGASLGMALARSPLALPAVVLGIIQAGEAGSGAAPAVRRAAELTEQAAATRAAVLGALAYPAVLVVASTASVALLVGVVLPRFGAILVDLQQVLPPTTRLVLGMANVARAGALPVLLVGFISVLVGRSWTATDAGRSRWHGVLLRTPLLGTIRRAAATARIGAALSALLESGVPLAAGLLHAARAAGDAALAARLLVAREAIVTGERPSAALARADALTPIAIRLVRAGEESGQLAAMLAHIATLERERATRLIASAVRLLEPTIILAFGGLVGLVAAALLQAIYAVRPV
jgi:type II secretory pathway component PulF